LVSYILNFSVVFRLPPEDHIRVKQAVEVLILCFYCNCVSISAQRPMRALC